MDHKLSHYTIITDIVNDKNDRVVYSTRSSKMLVVPEICITYMNNSWFDEIPEKVLHKLIDAQIIVPEEEDELTCILNENREKIDHDADSGKLYEVIQPTAMCQLGCYYCGQDHKKKNLEDEIILQVVSRIRKKAANGNFTSMYIGWFGAEPLMGLKQMREMTEMFKEICDEFDMKYSSGVITNGMSLKPNIFKELVRDMNVTKIEVTLDGVAEYHDKHRYTKKGGNSFDLIYNNLKDVTNLKEFDESGCKLTIRCNVDYSNREGVYPLIKKLADDGMHKKIAYFYPVGIYAWGGNDAHKKSLTKEEYARKEIEWEIEMVKLGFYPETPLPSRRKKVCIVVDKNSEVYDAYGNTFNCTEISYSDYYKDSEYELLHIKDLEKNEIKQKPRPLGDWNEDIANGKFPCTSCRMLPVCGGACPKSWHEGIPSCPPFKFNVSQKIKLAYLIRNNKGDNLESELNNFSESLEDKLFFAH